MEAKKTQGGTAPGIDERQLVRTVKVTPLTVALVLEPRILVCMVVPVLVFHKMQTLIQKSLG